MPDIAKLYELQKLDSTWEKVRRRLVQIRALLVESDEVKNKRALLTEAEAEHHRWVGQQRDAELEVQSLAQRITATEEQLMSGRVRNPKELESLQASLEALRRQREGVENAGVEALLHVEEFTSAVTKARSLFTAAETNWKTSQSELIAEETKMKKAFLQCKKQREVLVAAIDESALKRYEDLRQRKAGVAIAAVERNNLCSACHVQLPTGVVSSARTQGATPVLCTSCGRILFAA